MAKGQKRDIYLEVTDRILELLDQGTVPWRNPIRRGTGDGWPKNLASKKRYRGINVFLLAIRAWQKGFGSDYWLTFRQAAQKGGSIQKGEKATLVTFWKLYDTQDKETGEDVTLPVLRHFNVFNVEQCEGIAAPDAPEDTGNVSPFAPLEKAEAIVRNYSDPPTITYTGNRARYLPMRDCVRIPSPERFQTREDFWSVLYHELTHSTGHSKRLNRGLDESPAPFGSPDYSKEELVAEMGAAFLNAAAGISPPTIEQSASYIDNWRKKLKGDKRLVVHAAGAAQKAADWILGEDYSETGDDSPAPQPPSVSPLD